MKPENTNPPIDLGDGAPVRCVFYSRSDVPPSFMEDCEQDATGYLDDDTVMNYEKWKKFHTKSPIGLRRKDSVALCDSHLEMIRTCAVEGNDL